MQMLSPFVFSSVCAFVTSFSVGILFSNLFLSKFPSELFQECDSSVQGQVDLVSHRNETLGQGFVVLHHESDRDHQIIDIVEY